MYKRIIYLFLLIFLFACQDDKNNQENHEWIASSSSFVSGPDIYLNFISSDSLILVNIFRFEHAQKYKFHIDTSNWLVLNDTLVFGQIIKQSDDTLIIEDSLSILSFIPMVDFHIDTDTNSFKELLLSNDWYVSNGNDQVRMFFTAKPYYYHPGKYRWHYQLKEIEGWESSDEGWWAVSNIGNALFLGYSVMFGDQIFQITGYCDTIITSVLYWQDSFSNITFKAQKSLSENNYKGIRNNLLGTWNLFDYVEPFDSASLSIFPTRRKRRGRPFNPIDSVPKLLHNYYVENLISYTFSPDGTCSMDALNTNLRMADWILAKDGKYIKTENSWLPSMRIISITDSVLIIEKLERIEYVDGDGYDWRELYIREKLKKDN